MRVSSPVAAVTKNEADDVVRASAGAGKTGSGGAAEPGSVGAGEPGSDGAGGTGSTSPPGGQSLRAFPPPATTPLRLGLAGAARRRGLALRPATGADFPFLRGLFAELRRPELDAAGWPEPLRAAFCDNQFALQHESFTRHFHRADFLVVLCGGAPVGRLYLDRTLPVFHIVEIALLASARGMGLGGLLLDAVKSATRRASADAVTLQVYQHNLGAQRFYQRAGFRKTGEEASHILMRWNR